MTQISTLTYDQILGRIIDDGIAEVRVAYAEPQEHHKRDGAIDGFEACRGKTPAEIVELWVAVERECALARTEKVSTEEYWKLRYKSLQLEFVLNVLSVGLGRPLLAHLPTARGAMKYAAIVGTRDNSVGLS